MSLIRDDSYASILENFKTRRQTHKLDDNSSYSLLKPHTTIQYFREDYGGVTSLRFNEDGSRVAVGFNSGELQLTGSGLIDRRGGADIIVKGWPGNYSISCLHFHPQQPDMLYASSTAGKIHCFEISDVVGKVDLKTEITEENNEINSFDFNPSSTRLATGGSDAAVRIYDPTTNTMVLKYAKQKESDGISIYSDITDDSVSPHSKRIYCVRWHPEHDSIFVTGGWDKVVKVWDVRVGDVCMKSIVGPYIFGEAIDIWDEQLLTASCVANNSLELWDLGTGDLLKNIALHNKQVYLYGEMPYVAQFCNGDATRNLVLTGLGQGGLQVISIKDDLILYLMEDEKTVLAVDSMNGKLVYGGKSNTIMFGNIIMKSEVYSPPEESREGDGSSVYTHPSV